MDFDEDKPLDPLPVPFKTLAELYQVSVPALRKAGRKLQLRPEFLENPYAIRDWMTIDGFSRGKLRRLVFDEVECKRVFDAVEKLRYPNGYYAPKAN